MADSFFLRSGILLTKLKDKVESFRQRYNFF